MDRKLMHLEFIQGVVNRLSTNSFLLKGWSVVLVSALFALSASDVGRGFAPLAFIPGVMFWGLDGYFLSVERSYRGHYDRVRVKQPDEIDFCMACDDLHSGFVDWFRATFSWTLFAFHGAVIASIVLVTALT